MASFSSRGPNPRGGRSAQARRDRARRRHPRRVPRRRGRGAAVRRHQRHVHVEPARCRGCGARRRDVHPTWTPDEVRSRAHDHGGHAGRAQGRRHDRCRPVRHGGGPHRPRAGRERGPCPRRDLADYAAANPAAGGDPRTLNLPSMADNACDGFCSWTRTVKNAAELHGVVDGQHDGAARRHDHRRPEDLHARVGRVAHDHRHRRRERGRGRAVALRPGDPHAEPGSVPTAHLPVAAYAKGEVTETRGRPALPRQRGRNRGRPRLRTHGRRRLHGRRQG